jgi:hypothetical protein
MGRFMSQRESHFIRGILRVEQNHTLATERHNTPA